MKAYDVFEEASTLVEDQLELMRALYEAKQTMAAGQSRRVCRCGSCKSHREITLNWLDVMNGQSLNREPSVAQQAASVMAATDASLPSD